MSLFLRRKNPDQLVKLLREALATPTEPKKLDKDGTPVCEVTKRLHQMKLLLYGEGDQEAKPEKCVQLASLLVASDLVPKLIKSLETLPFEARKQFAQVYCNLMRRDLASFVEYVNSQPEILSALIVGYENPEIALNCGTMLRESIRHEALARRVLYSDDLWKFFDSYVHYPNFEVGSDAFATFKDLLTRHKELSSQYFTSHFDQVFTRYNSLLTSENYVTRRQSLKLLGEILLDRSNFEIMMKYIAEKENLKMMMNLLRDTSANIQFEAFHVFKVFVANPRKPDAIAQILLTNRTKLVAYLKNFQNSKEDPQFIEEKALLIRTLETLASTDEQADVPTAVAVAVPVPQEPAAPTSSSPSTADGSAAVAPPPAPTTDSKCNITKIGLISRMSSLGYSSSSAQTSTQTSNPAMGSHSSTHSKSSPSSQGGSRGSRDSPAHEQTYDGRSTTRANEPGSHSSSYGTAESGRSTTRTKDQGDRDSAEGSRPKYVTDSRHGTKHSGEDSDQSWSHNRSAQSYGSQKDRPEGRGHTSTFATSPGSSKDKRHGKGDRSDSDDDSPRTRRMEGTSSYGTTSKSSKDTHSARSSGAGSSHTSDSSHGRDRSGQSRYDSAGDSSLTNAYEGMRVSETTTGSRNEHSSPSYGKTSKYSTEHRNPRDRAATGTVNDDAYTDQPGSGYSQRVNSGGSGSRSAAQSGGYDNTGYGSRSGEHGSAGNRASYGRTDRYD